MSDVKSLVLNSGNLGSGPIRNRIGVIAAGIAIVGLFTKLGEVAAPIDTAEGISTRIEIVNEIASTVTDLTATKSDDDFVATVEKYIDTPEAANLLAAAIAFYKSIKQIA